MSCLRQAGKASVNKSPDVSCQPPSSRMDSQTNHLGLDGFEEEFCVERFGAAIPASEDSSRLV